MFNENSQKSLREKSSSQKVTRPRNAEETRAALLAAARLRFARDGYEATGLRDIAADAGVNVALISRYFGSKNELFQAVIAFDRNRIREAMQGPPEQMVERLLKGILADPSGSDHDLFVTLLRSSDYPPAVEYIRSLLDALEADLAQLSDAPDAKLRAGFVTALLTGMVVLRRLVSKPPLSEASADELLPLFQNVLTTLLSGEEALHPSRKETGIGKL